MQAQKSLMQAQKSLRKTLSVEGAHPIRQVGTPGCHGGHRMYESRWGTFVWNRAWKNPGRQTELWRIVNTLSTHPNDRPPTARGAQRWRRAHKIFRVGDCRLQATGENAGGACTALIGATTRSFGCSNLNIAVLPAWIITRSRARAASSCGTDR